MTKLYLIIACCLCINWACTNIQSGNNKSDSTAITKLVPQVTKANLQGQWICYYTQSISPKGRVTTQDYIASIPIFAFKDTTYERIMGAVDGKEIIKSGTFQINNDRLFLSGKRPYTINNFSESFMELEEYPSKLLIHQKLKLKRLKHFKQSKQKSKVNNFLVNNPIKITHTTAEKACLQITRFEFENNTTFKRFTDCKPGNASLYNNWYLNEQIIQDELFIHFNSSQIRPIQVKSVSRNKIIGMLYDDENTEVVIEKYKPITKPNILIGSWEVESDQKKKLQKIEIQKKLLEIHYLDTNIETYQYHFNKTRDLIYLTPTDNNAEKKRYTARLTIISPNNIKLYVRETDNNKYWNSIKLNKHQKK